MAQPPAKNTVCLWYNRDAEEAAHFYARTFPDSSVGAVHRAPADFPSGKAGDTLVVEFTVMGIRLHWPERRAPVQAQRSVLIPGGDQRPGRDRSLLERHRPEWRPGKRVRLVQGQVGHLLANNATRADEGDGWSRSCRRQARFRGDDADEENRRCRDPGSGLRPEGRPCELISIRHYIISLSY